ncbi:MAG: tRNA pseudouridine(38-40) synthase TruA [Burkholderiales bacterium]|nr:tRNA pseudouridine(38-40) synthase TruA [Burkholderiales bacterium]
MRVALGLEYDGCAYEGWQTQPSRRTVQDVLQAAVFKFTQEKVKAVCAGRTDAGVHATGQVVHLDAMAIRTEQSWVRGVNSFLEPTVCVRWARIVPDDFHARFSAFSRSYEYWIANEPMRSALLAGRTAWIFRPLDEQRMQEATTSLIGTHDFSSFRAAGCQSKTPIKTISEMSVDRFGRLIRIRVKADGFLYHMVRNIVGCLVYIGTGARPVEWMQEVLEAKSRDAAAPTSYPAGLYLSRVGYPEKFGLPDKGKSPFAVDE